MELIMGFDFNSLLAFIIFGVTIGVVYGIVALGISLIDSGTNLSEIRMLVSDFFILKSKRCASCSVRGMCE